MAWDEGKFFDNLNREKNRLQENPHLTEIERETYLAAFAELQMYLLNTSGPPNGRSEHMESDLLQEVRDLVRLLQNRRLAKAKRDDSPMAFFPLALKTAAEVARGAPVKH